MGADLVLGEFLGVRGVMLQTRLRCSGVHTQLRTRLRCLGFNTMQTHLVGSLPDSHK
jgi:hypothetical protein